MSATTKRYLATAVVAAGTLALLSHVSRTNGTVRRVFFAQ